MAENMLDKKLRKELGEVFQEQLKLPAALVFFGSQVDCDYCEETIQLGREVAELSEFIHFYEHDLDLESELAESFQVDKAPTLVVAAQDDGNIKDYGIRFAGIPAGHEFVSFIQAILMVSGRDSGLARETVEFLQGLTEPLNLQVFVTPT